MKSIREFFQRIQNKQAQEMYFRLNVQEVIQKHAKMQIPLENLTFSGKKITIGGLSSAARSVIFIKKTAILKELAEKMPEKGFTELH